MPEVRPGRAGPGLDVRGRVGRCCTFDRGRLAADRRNHTENPPSSLEDVPLRCAIPPPPQPAREDPGPPAGEFSGFDPKKAYPRARPRPSGSGRGNQHHAKGLTPEERTERGRGDAVEESEAPPRDGDAREDDGHAKGPDLADAAGAASVVDPGSRSSDQGPDRLLIQHLGFLGEPSGCAGQLPLIIALRTRTCPQRIAAPQRSEPAAPRSSAQK